MNIFPHFHTHILHISIIYEVSSFSLFKQRGVHSEKRKKPYVHRFVVDKWNLATEQVENQTKMFLYQKLSQSNVPTANKTRFPQISNLPAHSHNTFNCVMLNVWSAHIFFVGFLSFFSAPSRVRFSHMFFISAAVLVVRVRGQSEKSSSSGSSSPHPRMISQHELYENYLNSFFLFRLPPTNDSPHLAYSCHHSSVDITKHNIRCTVSQHTHET